MNVVCVNSVFRLCTVAGLVAVLAVVQVVWIVAVLKGLTVVAVVVRKDNV